MQPLSANEARQLDRLERGFGWRLLVGPAVGAIGGLVFAYLLWTPGGRFLLGDTSPAYAALETAVGSTAAFYLLCMGAFMGVGLFALVVIMARLTRLRRALQMRRDVADVMPGAPR
jgi:hypothetical protein